MALTSAGVWLSCQIRRTSRSGVQKLIKNECPEVLDVGCICHLADLTIKSGIFYYFYHSCKRKQEFCDHWCSLFTSEPQTILKHCPTRWLSLLRCVGRYISQYDGLKSYFVSCSEAESSKVANIIKQLENPLTKPILHFLSFILPSMDRFNRMFQKSTQNTTSQLYTEMSRLVRLYASNFLKPEFITAAGNNLQQLSSFTQSDILPYENLGLGDSTWSYLSVLQEEFDLKPFYEAVQSFYVASLKKMLIKFPFEDSILKDLGIINPDQVCSYSHDTVVRAKRFPQLGLSDPSSIDKLKEEFMDFKLSPTEHPSVETYKSATGDNIPRAGTFWNAVSNMKTVDGDQRFGSLVRLMEGLLTIPCSNADSERGFSILRKIHTDQRSSMKQATIVSLMTIKFNSEECCYDTVFSEELLAKCKRATVVQNKQY